MKLYNTYTPHDLGGLYVGSRGGPWVGLAQDLLKIKATANGAAVK